MEEVKRDGSEREVKVPVNGLSIIMRQHVLIVYECVMIQLPNDLIKIQQRQSDYYISTNNSVIIIILIKLSFGAISNVSPSWGYLYHGYSAHQCSRSVVRRMIPSSFQIYINTTNQVSRILCAMYTAPITSVERRTTVNKTWHQRYQGIIVSSSDLYD